MLPIGSELFDCLCIMIVIAAIENSELNRRIAIKLLLVFGCSHYRYAPYRIGRRIFLGIIGTKYVPLHKIFLYWYPHIIKKEK